MTPAQIMDGSRDQFLVRAGFPANKNGGIGRSPLFHLAQHATQRFALADDLLELQFAANFILEVEFFQREFVFEVGNLTKGARIFDCDRDLARDLRQKNEVVRTERIFAVRTERKDANDSAAAL